MAEQRYLFLLGGSAAYPDVADDFVMASGGMSAHIAVLVQSQAGWEKYQTEITSPWVQRGVTHVTPIFPSQDGTLNEVNAAAILQEATGVFIGGGHTPTYHRLFGAGTMRQLLRTRYFEGIPLAGISAGAVLLLEHCQLTQDETGAKELQVVEGLGLLPDVVVGVHFTEWDALPEVLAVMEKTRTPTGFGIDEPACLMYVQEQLVKVLGASAYKISMTEFEHMSYTITPVQTRS
jgi:cyanophycinase